MVKKVRRHVSKVGIVTKLNNPDATALAEKIGNFLVLRGRKVFYTHENARISRRLIHQHQNTVIEVAKRLRVVAIEKLPEYCDLIIVLGGDGTYIGVARQMKKRSVPVLGINMGQLGFLTEIKKEETFEVLTRILDRDELRISERSLLNVTLLRGKKKVFESPVVNDAVISKAAIARIVGIQVEVNNRQVTTLRADGVIVSTPTGSTAYSLAAGGPILEPSLPAILISPICAHSLTHRPIIVPDFLKISLSLSDRLGPMLLTLDGQDAIRMRHGDVVEVQLFKRHRLQLVSSPSRDYFDLLREKFKFGVRA